MSKNLVFVIDISGSMEGQKVKQVSGGFARLSQQELLWLILS